MFASSNKPASSDAETLKALKDLEGPINDLRCLSHLVELCIQESVSNRDDPVFSRVIKSALPQLELYRVLVLSRDQHEALLFTQMRLHLLTEEVRTAFYAAMEVGK